MKATEQIKQILNDFLDALYQHKNVGDIISLHMDKEDAEDFIDEFIKKNFC